MAKRPRVQPRAFLQGEVLWGSGFVLASWLAESGLACSQRVLELGSGLGIGGLSAAALGASEVLLTDRPGPVLEALRMNLDLNLKAWALLREDSPIDTHLRPPEHSEAAGVLVSGRSGETKQQCLQIPSVSAVALDWGAHTHCEELGQHLKSLGIFDVVVGSDLIYDQAAPGRLLSTLQCVLAPGGCFACVDPGRLEDSDGSASCHSVRQSLRRGAARLALCRGAPGPPDSEQGSCHGGWGGAFASTEAPEHRSLPRAASHLSGRFRREVAPPGCSRCTLHSDDADQADRGIAQRRGQK
ncbi:unnamed protein product [Polarella glacialis]|uniref:Calmodulin-lysine N-methyltransferase n=1 Tax=Polarella glacialis TaxID=89957 RepID=A0A813DRS2_POLGL|nr:unnamed protein product [Polarella glacialis]